MQKICRFLLSFVLLLTSSVTITLAGEATGTVDTGTGTGPEGTVITAPTASPAAGSYSSTQSVTLTASGAPYICYSTSATPACNWDALTCTTGTKYSSAISVASTTTIKALSCYQGGDVSGVSSFTYTISTGGGGGGGGGSTGPITDPYILSLTPSTSNVDLSRPVSLSLTEGLFTRPVTLYDFYNTGLTVEIPAGTKVTTADGKPYAGIINPPDEVSTGSVPQIVITDENGTPVFAFLFGLTGKSLYFSNPIKITIPLTDVPESIDRTKLRVFYYDESSGTYKLAGDGGQLASDGKSISVEVTHLTKFAVFETSADTLAASNVPAATQVDGFSDVLRGTWYAPFVEKLYDWGAISGYPDGTFKPAGNLNRAEIAKIIAKAFALTIPETVSTAPFKDVPADSWYAPYVLALKNAGIINGYPDGTYRPAGFVNRAEAMKIIIGATSAEIPEVTSTAFSDVPGNSWYAKFVQLGKVMDVINGYPDGTFKPASFINRAEASKIIVNAKEKL